MRLDRWLATLPDVGSRGAAERLLEAGTVRVDGSPRSKSHKLMGGETVGVRGRGSRDGARVGAARTDDGLSADDHLLVVPDKPSRGCRSSPAPATPAGRSLARALALAGSRGRGGGRARRHRAPHRPRYVRPARRGALTGGVRGAPAARQAARARARVPGPRRRQAALAARNDRRADRSRPARPRAPLARHGDATRRGDALRGSRRCSTATRCYACGSRRDGRTRSACTSRRSSCPSPATERTGGPVCSAWTGSSFMQRGSPSRIPSPARRSTSPRLCRRIWPSRWRRRDMPRARLVRSRHTLPLTNRAVS